MKTCPACGKALEDDAKFCGGCGSRIEAPAPAPAAVFCPNCGTRMTDDSAFCPNCGTSVKQMPDPVPLTGTPPMPAPKPKKAFKLPKKALIIGAAALAIVVVAVLAIVLFSGSGSKGNYELYLKDNEIYYTDFSKKDPVEITSRLTNGADLPNEVYEEISGEVGDYIAFSKNGKRMFYPDRVDMESEGITLYYRDLNKPKQDPVKIDADVSAYSIDEAGTSLVYIKGSDRILYHHDLEEKQKIASNVDSFAASADCEKVAYLNEEGSFYVWYAGEDSIKVASDVESVESVSDDLTTIYYIKDGSLYCQAEGESDRQKIGSDVYHVIRIYDSGEVYFTKQETAEVTLMDYVTDDLASADAAMEEPEDPVYPEEPEYPSRRDYDTTAAYNDAKDQYEEDMDAYDEKCDEIYAAYEEAYELWWAKLERDDMRETLKTWTVSTTSYSLYYYDGESSTLVTDRMAYSYGNNAYSSAAILVQLRPNAAAAKIKLSEVESVYDVESMVSYPSDDDLEYQLAIGPVLNPLDQETAVYYRMSSNGDTLYFLDDLSEDGYGDLYKIIIDDGVLGSAELFDVDVCTQGLSFVSPDQLAYFKNVNTDSWKGDLYIDGEEVDYDVLLYSVSRYGDDFLYFTDWNSEKEYGTLKVYNGKDKEKVADDIHDYTVTASDDILYLYDYSLNYYKGSLYLYDGKDATKIDDDVSGLIFVSADRVKGEFYGW